jgi:hypothetical protein
MSAFADDDVVVHGNAERRRDIDDRLHYLDVGGVVRGSSGTNYAWNNGNVN